MKKLVFKYKRWHFRLIVIANLLIPLFIFASCGQYLKGIDATISGDIKSGLVFATAAALTFLCFGLSYIFQTFKTENYLKKYLRLDKMDKAYYRRISLGLTLYAVSMCIMILIVTGRYFATEEKAKWFKFVVFPLAGITLILGVLSNINIHQFEASNYFKIFYYRHKNEDVHEVLDDLVASEQKRKVKRVNK